VRKIEWRYEPRVRDPGDSDGVGLIELSETGRGFVDLERLLVLRAVYGAGEVPIGVEEVGGGGFDAR
jgi:hypothetical protein